MTTINQGKVNMINLMLGDCLERMKEIESGSVDLTVTSPPYDNLRSYNGNNEKWNESVWKGVLSDLYRVTKTGGVVVWVVADATIKGSETGTSFKQALYAIECGFNLHDTMIFEKDSFQKPNHNRYWSCFEYMFVFSKRAPTTHNMILDRKNSQAGKKISSRTVRNSDGTTSKRKASVISNFGKRKNIWAYSTGFGKGTTDKSAYMHPATFPEGLVRDHIISWSNESDIILDPFMGSGTTGKIAKNLNRSFIGIEMDEGYFNIAKDRINKAGCQCKKRLV